MLSLNNRSSQLGEIVTVINDIANSANLLALDTAIEAVRTGDKGKGLDLATERVRRLAERTVEATSEIQSRIAKVRQDITKTVESIEDRPERTAVGALSSADKAAAERAWRARDLDAILRQISTVTEQMSAISDMIGRDIDA